MALRIVEPLYVERSKFYLKPLRYFVVDKHIGFDREMTNICDDWYAYIDSKFINIVREHDDSLECHGFNRSAINLYELKSVLEQPVLNATSHDIISIIANTVRELTIELSSCCSELRTRCKYYDGNHYIHRLHRGHFASIYAFVYNMGNNSPKVSFQIVNYGKRNMEGSFIIDRDIIEKVYNMLEERSKK